ncbi:MAG: FecR domain-containing protein [Tannerella sp.]|jgi:ferric-dicitrate binding protein FerR (iron transport regulator)|nr:FecR domain-containing protein [Tannerella sp.]
MNIKDITNKYLNNSATEEEKKYLLQWLEEKEENKNQFKKTYDLWIYTNALLTEDTEMEAALARLKKRTSSHQKKKMHLSLPHSYRMRVAAFILLLLSVGYTGYWLGDHNDQKRITMNHLLTGPDGKGEYLLPDGSTVWLNANSVLKYPATFTGGKRTVQLEGEALFEVKEDRKKPFFVNADGLDIEVVGTRFLARNYSHKNMVQALLVNGCVKISGNYFPGNQTLHPGELLTYNKQTGQTDLQNVNTDDYTNWIHSKMVFDKTNLAHVIINLEKWFDVEIVATPELIRNTHMSFTVRRESLEEILKNMALTAPIDYKWEGKVLHLFPKK